MRGRVLGWDNVASQGQISGDDGQRYTFRRPDWRESQWPMRGQVVDFEGNQGNAANIYLLHGAGAMPGAAPVHKDKVAAIGLDFEDAEKQDIDQFLQKHPLSYPVAQVDIDHPPQDFDTPKGLPNTYVIAPDGHVAKAFLGPITTKDLEAAIGG